MTKRPLYNLLTLLLLASCGPAAKIQYQVTPADLIGGSQAKTNEYPSTVSILNGCTASKVGRKLFLMAAHCILDTSHAPIAMNPKFTPNSFIWIKTANSGWQKLKIDQSYHHPSYSALANHYISQNLSPDNVNGLGAYDVGLLSVKEETPMIPSAEIDFTPIAGDDEVIIGGYGCEQGLGLSYDYSKAIYKVQSEKVIEESDIYGDDPWRGDNAFKANQFVFYTPGKAQDSSMASICPGDSGGPVYRKNNKKIVGVNSYYLFENYSSIVPYQNAHTRLSEVSEWIKKILSK